MPLRMAITKVSGQGEQIVIDVSQWNGVTGEIVHQTIEEMSTLFSQAMDIVDVRLLEMNMRMLEAYKMRDYFDPEHWMKVVGLFDVLAGRQDMAALKRKWDDAIEENRELAEARQAAYNSKIADDDNCELCGTQHDAFTCCSDADLGKSDY